MDRRGVKPRRTLASPYHSPRSPTESDRLLGENKSPSRAPRPIHCQPFAHKCSFPRNGTSHGGKKWGAITPAEHPSYAEPVPHVLRVATEPARQAVEGAHHLPRLVEPKDLHMPLIRSGEVAER